MFISSISIDLFVGICLLLSLAASAGAGGEKRGQRARELGIEVGTMKPGRWNAITDVPGVLVGHKTLSKGKGIRTGVTAILPHGGDVFQNKVPAAVYVGNGFGKLAGSTQIEELGNIETPIVLTNTLSVGTAVRAVVRWVLERPGNEEVRSVNAVVGETNDGYLSDIRSMPVSERNVIEAIESAKPGPVAEGAVGAGTGTVCFGYKGGIGTSSRIVLVGKKRYAVGVLVQTNYGGSLVINGAPVGRELSGGKKERLGGGGDGSCMVVVATDAPLSSRNLKRLARRAIFGLARTGSYMSNGSGDYVIAFSTAYTIPYRSKRFVDVPHLVANEAMTSFFQAVVEATEEAVYNSLFMAETTEGYKRRIVEALPVERVLRILEQHRALAPSKR